MVVALKANIHKLAGRREDAFRVYTQKWRGARIFLRGHGNIHKLRGEEGMLSAYVHKKRRIKKKEYMYTKLKRGADFPRESVF